MDLNIQNWQCRTKCDAYACNYSGIQSFVLIRSPEKNTKIKYPVQSSGGTVSREHFCKPQICTNVFVSKGWPPNLHVYKMCPFTSHVYYLTFTLGGGGDGGGEATRLPSQWPQFKSAYWPLSVWTWIVSMKDRSVPKFVNVTALDIVKKTSGPWNMMLSWPSPREKNHPKKCNVAI